MLVSENKKLSSGVESEIHTIEISDRKTYYESEQNKSIGWWSNILSSLYKYLVVLVIVTVIMKNNYHDKNKWFMIIGLIIYPYTIYFIIDLIFAIYRWIISNTKWVYLKW
jgi:hypothetical protein